MALCVIAETATAFFRLLLFISNWIRLSIALCRFFDVIKEQRRLRDVACMQLLVDVSLLAPKLLDLLPDTSTPSFASQIAQFGKLICSPFSPLSNFLPRIVD